MHVIMHARTYARPYILMHLCPYVSVYDTGRHACAHVYMHMQSRFDVCWRNACIYLFPCKHVCQNKLRTCELLSESSPRTCALWSGSLLFAWYTGPFLIWAVSQETGTIAYADCKGSEQSARPQLMLWPYKCSVVVNISSLAKNSLKYQAIFPQKKNSFRILCVTF